MTLFFNWPGIENRFSTTVISQVVPKQTMLKEKVIPKFKPTSDPIILLFFWLTSGYNLQPDNQYTFVNNSKTLYTDSGRSVLETLVTGKPHYTWYQSTDGLNWTDMKVDDINLTVTPSSEGTVYYQQKTKWPNLISPLIGGTTVYSKVAFVTTFPKAIDAKTLTVSAASDYLYSNQSTVNTTFVKGIPDPVNATGNIIWKSSDTSLATVNSHTGVVSANNSGKAGKVIITGTMVNSNGTAISGDVRIKIGGGLDDVKVDSGKTAEFKIQGHFDQKPTSVVWYKVSTDGGEKVIDNSGSNMSYTISQAAYVDNGSKYYAVMTIDNGNGTTSEIKTNQATLTVIRNTTPDVKITNMVFNHSHDDHNETNTVLNGVSKDNKLTYQLNISDENADSAVVSGVVGLKIPKTVEITANDVQLDGQSTVNVSEISDPDNDQGAILIINKLDFSKVKSHLLMINGTVGTSDNVLSHTSTVEFLGLDSKNNYILQMNGQTTMTLNFANKLLTLKAHDWQYPTINTNGRGQLLSRIKMTDNALDVSDNRVEKKAAKLYIIQKEPLKSSSTTLNSEIRYYQTDGNYMILDDKGTLVEETNNGESLKSISWIPKEGPLLHIDEGPIVPGNYSTKLEWSVVQSV